MLIAGGAMGMAFGTWQDSVAAGVFAFLVACLVDEWTDLDRR